MVMPKHKDRKMTTHDKFEPLKPGTVVRIRHSCYPPVRVAEYRGPFGPKGAHIYSVLVSEDPDLVYIEVREDQLEVLQKA